MFVGGGVIAIFVGMFCIWDSDLAWHLYEMDSRTVGIHVERPNNWRDRVYYAGVALMAMGIAAIILGVEMMIY